MIRLGLVLLALLCASCGRSESAGAPLDLPIETLEDAPAGEAVAFYGDVRPGRWLARVEKTWTKTSRRGKEEGSARVELLVEISRDAAGLVTRTAFSVPETDGLGGPIEGGYDGLHVRLAHDATGRPDAATLTFEEQASPGARDYVRGVWAAGLGGTTPWVPAHPVAVGTTWTRRALRGLEALARAEGARTSVAGGGRLESVREEDGERVAEVRLESVVEVEGGRRGKVPGEVVSFGVRDRGHATLRVRDGLPLRWSLEETVDVRRAAGADLEPERITLHVTGSTSPLPPGDR